MTITPEKIKELFPDYKKRASRAYYMFDETDEIFFTSSDMFETIKNFMDGDPEYYSETTIETKAFNVGDIDNAYIVYSFYDEDLLNTLNTEGSFYAFQGKDHLEQYLQSRNYSSHNIDIRIQ